MTETTEQRIRSEADDLERRWETDPRWSGVERTYSAEEVVRLRGSFRVEHSVARHGAERLWELLQTDDYIAALGALTGGQAVEMVKAGLQRDLPLGMAGGGRREPRRADLPRPVACTRPTPCRRSFAASTTRCSAPTRSRGPRAARPTAWRRSSPTPRPASAGPERVRADEVDDRGRRRRRALRGPAREREEVRAPRRQGPRADRRSSSARSPPRAWPPTCCDVPTVLVARTDALGRDAADEPTSTRATARSRPASARTRASTACERAWTRRSRAALAYAPYCDMLWCETATPDLEEARAFADGDPRRVPGQAARVQLLAVVQLEAAPGRRHDRAVPEGAGGDGLPVPVHHARRLPRAERRACSSWRRGTPSEGMPAYVRLQEREFAMEARRLHRHAAPGRGRHRLLRPGLGGHRGRQRLDARAEGLDRGGAVPRRGAEQTHRKGIEPSR